jgi:signal transduction histidine kinase
MKKKTFLILPGVVSILLTGCILTTLAFQYFNWEIRNSVQQQLEEDAYVYTGMITNKVNHYVTLMLSLRNLFKFSETVTRDEFTGFTAMLLSQEPGIKTLCWAPQVEQSQQQDYERNARKEGFLRFAFQPDLNLGRQSGTFYYPAYYVEPFEKNSSIFGRVLNGEALLSEAFEKAIQTGRPTSVINPLLQITQTPANSQNECWIIVPVFEQHGLTCTELGRRQYLQGYLIGIIDVSAMGDDILCNTAGSKLPVKFHIEDITGGRHQIFKAGELVCCEAGFDRGRHRIVTENQFEFADRVWKIYCITNEQSPFNQSNAWMSWLVFPVGGLLTGLLVLYLYTLYCRNELAGNLVEKRTCQLKEQKEKADAIAIEAERSNRAKSTFLAGMSHDIRTPMNVILGFCELLAEESLTRDQKNYVQTIHSNSRNLLMLLNDILDLSKIEAGKMHIDMRDFDLQEMLDSMELMFRVSTQNRGLDFRIISMTQMPRKIHSDPLRIRQCMVNLIGNAIKFTHQGCVYVRVSYDNERLKLAVEDTGIGVPPARQESIFNAFSPNDSGCNPESEYGSGLGLAITRQLARLMGGDITVQSQAGKGSVFTLEIPACTAEDKQQTIFQETGAKDGWGQI